MTTRKVKKPMIKLTVGALYYAHNEMTEDNDFNPKGYKEVIESPVIKNVSVSEEGESTNVYSSGDIYDSPYQASGTNIDVEVIAFDPEDLSIIRGEKISENGLIFSGGSKTRPFIALGYPELKSNNKFRYVWYPKCKLIENSDEVATSEESFSEQTDTLTFQAMPFNSTGDISIRLDTETVKGEGITKEEFFKQVIVEEADFVKGA